MRDIIISFCVIFLIVCTVLFLVWIIMGSTPTQQPTQQEAIQELKLCRDNNFDAYQSVSGHWYCKPLKK